jgi:hypothetical protein
VLVFSGCEFSTVFSFNITTTQQKGILLNTLMDFFGALYAKDRSLDLPLPSSCHTTSAVVMSCTYSKSNVCEDGRTY